MYFFLVLHDKTLSLQKKVNRRNKCMKVFFVFVIVRSLDQVCIKEKLKQFNT